MASDARVTLRCLSMASKTTSRLRSSDLKSIGWIPHIHEIELMDSDAIPRIAPMNTPNSFESPGRAFLFNAWYAAAWADELTDQMLPRRLLDIPVVFFRTSDGRPNALHDRCPHRFAPLHLGKRV